MTARAVLLVAGLSSPAFGQFRDWDTGNGLWSNALNWTPNGLPLSTETARIGVHAGAANTEVDLDMNDTVAGLQLTDGMLLDLNALQLIVSGNTTISGLNTVNFIDFPTTLRIRPSPAATEFSTANLTLSNQAEFNTVLEPISQISGLLNIDATSSVNAGGVINFTSNAATALRNEGSIRSSISALTLNQLGTGTFDLDGTSGNGSIAMNLSSGSDFVVNATELNDPFSGQIFMASESRLVMNLDQPWEADASSEIDVSYIFVNPYGPSRLEGAPVTLSGSVNVNGSNAALRILAETTVGPSAQFSVGLGDVLRFEGDTTVNGGSLDVGAGGVINFEGPTLMNAGDFQTDGDSFADGGIAFIGPTDWSGTVSINGAARQNGIATVTAATVINAAEFDMDGGGGAAATTWNINNNLVINAERIDEPLPGLNNLFDGTLNIAGGFIAKLIVNLPGTGDDWYMNGEMNLTGDAAFFVSRVGGSSMYCNGELTLVSGRAQIDADSLISSYATVDIGPASAILRMNAGSYFYPGTYNGAGTLQNGPNGSMRLANGVNLDQVGVVNQGSLSIIPDTFALVDRFAQTEDGTFRVSLGGYAPGVEHDLLIVTDGNAALDGTIAVSLTNLGTVQFYPQTGDEFIIVSADDGIVGSFDNVPVTVIDDLTFHWTVLYNAFNVTLLLESVVPACPGDVNGDGFVSGADLSVLLAQFGQSIEQWSDADLNGDGLVSGADLSVLLANFGNQC